MAKRHHRLLSALLAAMLLSSSAVTASATTVGVADSGAGSLAKYYSTNPNGAGKEAKITVDGDIGEWSEDMKIAQGTANDDPRVYRPNSMYEVPLDLYALYGAYDDSNLYLMWEMTNVQDIVAPGDDYPLSQGILYQTMNIPFFIALDTGKSDAIGNSGKTAAGETLWGSGITFGNNRINRLIAVSTNGANGPFVYGGDSSGLNAKEIYTKATSGIEFKYGLGINSKNVYGLDGAYGTTSSTNPRTIGDMCNDSGMWVDFNAKGHKTATMDFHYEMSIPLETLGITKSDVASTGVGALVIMTSGKSGMDCLPYDLSMNDQADLDDSAGSQENNSFEKSDEDDITCSFARIGNGSVSPTPTPTPTPEPVSDSDTTTDTSTDSEVIALNNETYAKGTVSKGDTVTITLGVEDIKNVLGISNTLYYESGLEFVSAKALYDGVQFNDTKDGSNINWNVSFGDGTSGKTFTSNTPLISFTFKATADKDGKLATNMARDTYDYDFNTIDGTVITAEVTKGGSSTDTDSDVVSKDMPISVKASANDTVKVSFKVDLSKVEGVSNTFVYDSDILEYVGNDKLDGVQVEVNQSTGIIRWNCINIQGGSNADVVTFNFKAVKAVNGNVGTNTIRELYDANGNDLSYSAVKASVAVEGGAVNTDTEVEGTERKIDVVAKKGDRVVVTFEAQNAKNAAGIQTVLDYDKSALRYNGDAASPFGVINADASNGRVAWNILFDVDTKGGVDLSSKSEIAVMTFTALKDITVSDNAATFKVVDFYDYNDGSFDADSTVSARAAVAARGEGKVPVTAKAGNYVIVECKAIDAAKALGIVEELTYDKNALTYLGYENEMGHFDVDSASKGTVRWSTMFDAAGTNLTAETNIVVFKFAANKDITSSEDVLSYVVDEFYDVDLKDFNTAGTTMVYAHAVSDGEQFPVDPSDPADPNSDVPGGNPGDTDPSDDTDSSTPITPGNSDTDTNSDVVINSDTDVEGTTVTVLFGDVDSDEAVTASDAVVVLRTSANIEELEVVAEKAADVNEDDSITSEDSLSILRFSVNLNPNSKAGQKAQFTFKFK